jgi:outer membrane lipoprotein SlyB
MRASTEVFMQCLRVPFSALAALVALAIGCGDARAYYDDSRYAYCRDQAERISGFYGPVPSRFMPGGAGRGAARGAMAGAAIGAIAGGDRRDIRRAARRGAVTGAIVGAARRERARDQYRDARYIYQLELERCMDHYR